MNSEDINVSTDDPPMDVPPDPVPSPTTNEFVIFQRDVMSYSQLMSQMIIDPSVGTSDIQYEAPHV
jgi:hypothetical protein